MNDRPKWALVRRRRKAAVEGFSASLLSHATHDCCFEAPVGLGERQVDRFAAHPAFYSPGNPVGLKWTPKPLFQEMDVVRLGSDGRIGAGAMVLPGVSVGDGAIAPW